MNKKYRRYDRKIKRNYIKYLEVHLADHCNLNCRGCCHFSPLSDEKFLSLEQFEKDAKRLAQIIHKKLKRLIFLGGEPLLNENILEFFKVAKRYFPKTDVQVLTNGILLPKMSETFWKTCRKLDIQIDITMYPIKFDYQKVLDKIHDEKVRYFIYDDGIIEGKQFDKYNLDISEAQDENLNFYENCVMAKDYAFLAEGKIYPCQLAHNIRIFNEYFGLDFKQYDQDFIDIYKVEDENEIYEFLTHPIPFCRYCDFSKNEKIKWGKSQKLKSEW